MKYLLDTNICIYLKNGNKELERKIEIVSPANCYVSEITVAELKFGVAKGDRRDENKKNVDSLLKRFRVIPIWHSLEAFAIERAELERKGRPIEKFDMLIAATAIAYNLTLVSNDAAFSRFKRLQLENWVFGITTVNTAPFPISPLPTMTPP